MLLCRPLAAAFVASLLTAAPQSQSQSPAPLPPAIAQQQSRAEAGLEQPWDVQKIVAALAADNQQLEPILQQLHPQEWYDKKGAPSAYIVQWQSAHQQIRDVLLVTDRFARQTDSLSMGFDLYFRLEALEMAARSVNEGAQRYADRPSADKLGLWLAKDFGSRERLRGYLQELAANTEQNFKIADAEAQRCRGMISRETPVKPSRKR